METIRLQERLLANLSARLLPSRMVTQDAKGKKIDGVDKVKSLSPDERMRMAMTLKPDGTASTMRGIWIPKPLPGGPSTAKKRSLGIPTIADRARQALLLLALDPEWEAKFELNSFTGNKTSYRGGRR